MKDFQLTWFMHKIRYIAILVELKSDTCNYTSLTLYTWTPWDWTVVEKLLQNKVNNTHDNIIDLAFL